MTWWHQLCMDNINQESLATSWKDLKNLMCARFVPSYYRRETLLKLQMLQQGSMCVDEYYKIMESMLLKVGLQFESEEEKVARFVSALRRDIQDLVELYEYSFLDKVLHLAKRGKMMKMWQPHQVPRRSTLGGSLGAWQKGRHYPLYLYFAFLSFNFLKLVVVDYFELTC